MYKWIRKQIRFFLSWISLQFKRIDWDTKILFVTFPVGCAGFERITVNQWWKDGSEQICYTSLPPSLLDTAAQCQCPEGFIKTHTNGHAHTESEGQPWGHDGLALRQRSIVAQIKGSSRSMLMLSCSDMWKPDGKVPLHHILYYNIKESKDTVLSPQFHWELSAW